MAETEVKGQEKRKEFQERLPEQQFEQDLPEEDQRLELEQRQSREFEHDQRQDCSDYFEVVEEDDDQPDNAEGEERDEEV